MILHRGDALRAVTPGLPPAARWCKAGPGAEGRGSRLHMSRVVWPGFGQSRGRLRAHLCAQALTLHTVGLA